MLVPGTDYELRAAISAIQPDCFLRTRRTCYIQMADLREQYFFTPMATLTQSHRIDAGSIR